MSLAVRCALFALAGSSFVQVVILCAIVIASKLAPDDVSVLMTAAGGSTVAFSMFLVVFVIVAFGSAVVGVVR